MDATVQDDGGHTPLHLAAQASKKTGVMDPFHWIRRESSETETRLP